MILVDTSSWIHFLRSDGDPVVRDRVREALINGQARLCPFVLLELWNGARGKRELQTLKQFSFDIPELAINDAVWQLAYEMARQLRSRGVTIAAADILIAACAKYHSAGLETADTDFELMKTLNGL